MVRFVKTHRISVRLGFTLLELIVVIAIFLLLLALLLPAIQNVRQAARQLETSNNLRQISLGVHSLSTANDDAVRNLPKTAQAPKNVYIEKSIFKLLIPYVSGPNPSPKPGATSEEIWGYFDPQVKCYLDASDISLTGVLYDDARQMPHNRISYSANMMAFNNFFSITSSLRDGASNTIGFTTHYFWCQERDVRTPLAGQLKWDLMLPRSALAAGEERRATFADVDFSDVMPVRDPATGKTIPTIAGRIFDVIPAVKDADARVPTAFYRGGLNVALFDGSVRTIRPTVDPSIFWSAVTPKGGESETLP